MKIKSTLLLSAFTAFALQTAVADDQKMQDKMHHQGMKSSEHSMKSSDQAIRLSKLMEAEVKTKDGQSLGKLEDVVINPQSGKINFAVLGRGGFLGMGERLVPVPWQAINVESEKEFTLNVDRDKLKSAPTTDKSYQDLNDPVHTVTIYRFFAVPVAAGGAGDDSQTETVTEKDHKYSDRDKEEQAE